MAKEINNHELMCALEELRICISEETNKGNKDKVKGMLIAYSIMVDRVVRPEELELQDSAN